MYVRINWAFAENVRFIQAADAPRHLRPIKAPAVFMFNGAGLQIIANGRNLLILFIAYRLAEC
jgi:hypothetical protein